MARLLSAAAVLLPLAAPFSLAAQAARTPPPIALLPGSVRSAGLQAAGAALVGDAGRCSPSRLAWPRFQERATSDDLGLAIAVFDIMALGGRTFTLHSSPESLYL